MGQAPRRKGDGLTRQAKDRTREAGQKGAGQHLKAGADPSADVSTMAHDDTPRHQPGSEFDASNGATPETTGAAGVSRAERRQTVRMARAEREEGLLAANKGAILAQYGKESLDDLTGRERSNWLREHRKAQVSRAKDLNQQEWDAKNAGTWRAMVRQRQRASQDAYGDMSVRQHISAVTGATKARAKASLDAAREAYRSGGAAGVAQKIGNDVKRVGENAAKNIKPAAARGLKVAGRTAAVGAIAFTGIATGPVGMAVAGGVLANRARKGWEAASDRRSARQEAMLQRLAKYDESRARAKAEAAKKQGNARPADCACGSRRRLWCGTARAYRGRSIWPRGRALGSDHGWTHAHGRH